MHTLHYSKILLVNIRAAPTGKHHTVCGRLDIATKCIILIGFYVDTYRLGLGV